MTREEAIEVIKQDIPCEYDTDLIEALNIAINALEHPERNIVAIVPCGDTVSRQAVLDIVNNPLNIRLDEIIKKLPPVTPERPKGHWEPDTLGFCRCSNCRSLWEKSLTRNIFTNYCPRCGADMRDGESEGKE